MWGGISLVEVFISSTFYYEKFRTSKKLKELSGEHLYSHELDSITVIILFYCFITYIFIYLSIHSSYFLEEFESCRHWYISSLNTKASISLSSLMFVKKMFFEVKFASNKVYKSLECTILGILATAYNHISHTSVKMQNPSTTAQCFLMPFPTHACSNSPRGSAVLIFIHLSFGPF